MDENEEETETNKLMRQNLIADEEQSAAHPRTHWMGDRNEVAPADIHGHGHGLALYEVK